jgi:GDP-D-mannose dehydratase
LGGALGEELLDELNADHTREALVPTDFTGSTLSSHFYTAWSFLNVVVTSRNTLVRPYRSNRSLAGSRASKKRASIAPWDRCSLKSTRVTFGALLGDPSNARAKLGWRHKTSFDALVKEMVEADVIAIRNEQARRKPRRLSERAGGISV